MFLSTHSIFDYLLSNTIHEDTMHQQHANSEGTVKIKVLVSSGGYRWGALCSIIGVNGCMENQDHELSKGHSSNEFLPQTTSILHMKLLLLCIISMTIFFVCQLMPDYLLIMQALNLAGESLVSTTQ